MTTPIAILIVGALVSWGASEVGDKKSDLNEVDEISKESDKQVRLIRFSIGNW